MRLADCWIGSFGEWRVQVGGTQNWVVVSNIFLFAYLYGEDLTNIFPRGWNHQLENDGDFVTCAGV